MSDILTTLHPENDNSTNLYPNIKRDNIPNGVIDRNKLDNDINSLLDSINESHPSGVDTSTNILAFTTNKGIYIGSDTGNWYYWDGTHYLSGGVYQAVQLNNGEVKYIKLDETLKSLLNSQNDIKNSIFNFIENKYIYTIHKYSKGSVNLSTGEYVDLGDVSGISFIDLENNDISINTNNAPVIKVSTGYKCRGVLLDNNKNFVSFFNYNTGSFRPSSLNNRKGYYIRLMVEKIDGVSVLPSSLSDIVSVEDNDISNIDNLDVIDEITYETNATNNIFDPELLTTESYYFDLTDGYTHTGSGSFRITPDFIDVDSTSLYLSVKNTSVDYGTSILLVYMYDEDGNYLGYRNSRLSGMVDNIVNYSLDPNTTKIRLYTNYLGIDASNICISYSNTSYEPYSIKIMVKKESIPPLDYSVNIFKNKKIVNFGDSIFGNTRPPLDISTKIANLTNATVYNLGFGGCRMSAHNPNWDAFSMYSLAYAIANNDFSEQNAVDVDNVEGMPSYFKETRILLESIDYSDVDIVTISYGTNDFTAGVTLDNDNNIYDTNTFGGALRYSIKTLLEAYPNLKIFVCTPIYRFWVEGGIIIDDSDTKTINGNKLTDFVDKTINISIDNKLTYIDNYYQLGINKFNRLYYFSINDGTHPNNNGNTLIAEHITKELF